VILDVGNRHLIAEDHMEVDSLSTHNLVEPEFDVWQEQVNILQSPSGLKLPQLFVALDQEVVGHANHRDVGQ